MLKNQLKLAFRNIIRNGTYSIINILGLTLGLASALLIVVYVNHELSYDRFHPDADRIYRISESVPLGDNVKKIASVSMALAPSLRLDFPELEAVTFFSRPQSSDVTFGGKRAYENRIHVVDEEFFKVFDFEFIEGSKENSLKNINSTLITETTAQKYFGNEDPIGKELIINQIWQARNIVLTVSGVLKDMPSNSHFHMDMLIGQNTLQNFKPEGMDTGWGWDSGYTYIKTPPNYSIENLEASFPAFLDKHMGYENKWLTYFTRKMTEIHLQSNLNSELEANGNIQDVYIFSIVAFAIIFIAAINYINMATAIASKRTQEVGIQKAMGALKGQLIRQFMTETIVVTLMASLMAGFLAEILTPAFNNISGRELEIGFLERPRMLLLYMGCALLVGLLSGIYPAFYLASMSSIQAMKGKSKGKKSLLGLRKGMLIFQFGISIFLIVGSLVVYNQWNFMKNKDYGLNTETTLTFSLQSADNQNRFETFKNRLETNPNILSISTSNRRIGRDINYQDQINIYEADSSFEALSLSIIYAEPGFLEDLGVKLISGRYFSRDNDSDINRSIILNKAAQELLKNPDVLGRQYSNYEGSGTVIGITENFHFESIYNKIKPIAIMPSGEPLRQVTLNISNNKFSETISFLTEVWGEFDPQRGFRYEIISDDIKTFYSNEQRFFNLFTIATGLAIFIASLGIFGLVSFSAHQRTKEIGIRKVLGADVKNITFILTKEFLLLIIIANMLAWPMAYWFSDGWLNNYSYRTNIQVWPFLIATGLALVVALATAATQTIKAARKNPVDSLRYE